MYQFYYAGIDDGEVIASNYKRNVYNEINIKKIKPTMWEEHCLECAAPLCYKQCPIYKRRIDGRCQRFENSISLHKNELGCCGESVRLRFRQWSNMMTIVFPSMLSCGDYQQLTQKNERLGKHLRKVAYSAMPTQSRWQYIRGREYLRRRKLRKATSEFEKPNMFVFHGYSFAKESFRLVIELYNNHTPVEKTSLLLNPGENLFILGTQQCFQEKLKANYLIKVYPEKNLEVELEVLWCDFVQAESILKETSAEKVKCLVWDLDNTLWDGILIEKEDPTSIQLRQNVRHVIEELDKRGIIQSIASKNDFEPTWNVIKHLGLSEYFLYPQIHWAPKSNSLKTIAENLNIGIDALALIDDSAFERAQVSGIYPQVRIYQETVLDSLLNLPEFSVLVTEESRNRRKMYQAEEKRIQLKSNDKLDILEFIEKCNLSIHIFEPQTIEEKQRCYELVVRTNQLNMSGVKYTIEEFEEVLTREGSSNFAFSSRDDFGEYGIVGFGQYYTTEKELIFSEFAMSCRVAGKYVESALFHELLERTSCEVGRFRIKKTKKNGLLVRTLKEIGFLIDFENDEEIDFSFTQDLKEHSLVKVQ